MKLGTGMTGGCSPLEPSALEGQRRGEPRGADPYICVLGAATVAPPSEPARRFPLPSPHSDTAFRAQANGRIYNAAVQVNSTVSNSSIGKVVTAQCGADFAKSAVSASAPASSAAAATGAGAAAAGSGAISSGAGWFVGAGTLAAVVLGAVVAL